MSSSETLDTGSSSWLRRVGHVQIERMTPELQRSLRQQVERQRAAEERRRYTRSMTSYSCRNSRTLSEGLRQMLLSTTSEEYSAARGRWQFAQTASSRRATTNLQPLWAEDEMRTWDDDAEEQEGLAEVSRLVGATERGVNLAEAIEAPAEFEAVLHQLSQEPTDDEEVEAKFGMYEVYGREVERMRLDLFSFRDSREAELPQAVAVDIRRKLTCVDRQEAMGIPDETRYWFVYYMMKQAEANNRQMNAILLDWTRKLELLARREQIECPICLEPFGEGRMAETLGCCHCVCGDCWQHWIAVMQPRKPFCPLCRHDEFVGFIATHTDVVAASPVAITRVPVSSSTAVRTGCPRLQRLRSFLTVLSPLRCFTRVLRRWWSVF
jgi:hypothetical protein